MAAMACSGLATDVLATHTPRACGEQRSVRGPALILAAACHARPTNRREPRLRLRTRGLGKRGLMARFLLVTR